MHVTRHRNFEYDTKRRTCLVHLVHERLFHFFFKTFSSTRNDFVDKHVEIVLICVQHCSVTASPGRVLARIRAVTVSLCEVGDEKKMICHTSKYLMVPIGPSRPISLQF